MSPPDIRWTVRRSGSNPQGPPRDFADRGINNREYCSKSRDRIIVGEEEMNDIRAAGGILFDGEDNWSRRWWFYTEPHLSLGSL